MVYPGHPSTGCLQCIRRKVKCDEGRPACRRCLTRGDQCPGYQRPRYRFVSSDPRAQTRTRKKRPLGSDDQPEYENELILSDLCVGPKTQLPSRDRQSEILPWYFASYTIPKEDGEAEWLNFLPKMYQDEPEGSHLRMAVNAASLAAFSNYFKANDLSSKARKAYGTALTALNNALRDQTEAKLDQTLTAVLNLLMFETITAGESPFDYHINGLLSMLQLRGEEQFQTARGRMLFRVVQLLLQTRPSLQKCRHFISPAEYDINAQAIRILPTLSSENSRVTARAILTLRINYLCVQAISLIEDSNHCPERKANLESLMDEAAVLDAKLESWIASFPSKLRPKEVRNIHDGSRRLIYVHHMIPIAWNMYRCGRILLHEMIIRCNLSLMRDYCVSCNDSKAQRIVATVRSLAEDLCDTVPFCLYDISDDGRSTAEESCKGRHAAAYLLLWPLTVVRLGSSTTDDQKRRATEALERIGNEMGIKQACRLLRDRKDLFET